MRALKPSIAKLLVSLMAAEIQGLFKLTGKKSFVLDYRGIGRKKLMTIGSYSVLKVDAA